MFETSLAHIKEKQQTHETEITKLGGELVNILFSTIKVAAMYEPNNNRYIEQAGKLREILAELFFEAPNFSLSTKGGYFFISGIRLKIDKENDAASSYFVERWANMGISGFSFNKDLTPEQLDKFVSFISGFEPSENAEDNFSTIKERLNHLKVEKIVPLMISEDQDEQVDLESEKKDSRKSMARKTFFKAIAAVQETIVNAQNHNIINLTKTKRVVQSLINQIITDEVALLEMTSLRSFDDYTYVHSVNVCVLSLVLGYHLGLDRKKLSDLGVGALLHDIGKTNLPVKLVNKPETFDEYDWKQMRNHPSLGVKAILKTRTVNETTARASATVFEHHIAFDGSGYPELLNKRKPSLFARIVSIIDTYDAMTSGRVYHHQKILPDEAITSMIKRIEKAFDPLLMKIFVNTLGIYPVGSVVTLSSREVGIVARNNPHAPEKPQVKIIANEGGLIAFDEVKIIDLSKEPGIYVTKIIDGEKHNIDIGNYIDIG